VLAYRCVLIILPPLMAAADVNNNALVRFQIVDFPGNYSLDDSDPKARLTPTTLFKRAGALVFVLDGQVRASVHPTQLTAHMTLCNCRTKRVFLQLWITFSILPHRRMRCVYWLHWMPCCCYAEFDVPYSGEPGTQLRSAHSQGRW
jgi:hypothetical protein